MTYYDYLIPIIEGKSLGTVGELRAYSEPKSIRWRYFCNIKGCR